MRDFEKPVVPDCMMSNDLHQAMEELCEHLYEVIMKCSSGLLRLVIVTSDLNAMDQLASDQDAMLTRWLKNLRRSVKSFIFANHSVEDNALYNIF